MAPNYPRPGAATSAARTRLTRSRTAIRHTGAMATRVRPPGTTSARGRPAAALLAVVALAVLLWGGYGAGWSWTGFGDNDTLWDWLHLLLLPVAVAALPLWLTRRGALHPRRRRVAELAAAAFVLLVALGYLVPIAWTGFPGNELWDWLELVLLPAVLVLAPLWPQLRPRLRRHHHVLLALAAAGLAVLVVLGYVVPLRWTGFTGNTLWDWLELVLAPLATPLVLVPAALAWMAVEEAGEAPAAREAAAPARVPATTTRGGVVPVLAAGVLALAVGLAAGRAAFGGAGDGTPTRCAPPQGRRRARRPARPPAGRSCIVTARSTPARRPGAWWRSVPVDVDVVRPAPHRVVYATSRCAGPRCAAEVDVARLTDGHRFQRARFPDGGPVTALAVSPRGAVAAMQRGRVWTLDGRGRRLVASGPAVEDRSLAGAGRTVYWPRGGAPASATLTG